MKTFLSRAALLLATVSVAAFAPSAAAAEPASAPLANAAKSCNSGWKHAVMPNGHKCLRAGQYCSRKRGFQRRYHSYGFHCKANGRLKRR